MPIYEYRCASCGHVFEQFSFSREGEGKRPCPVCRTGESGRIVSSFCSPHGSGGGSGSGSGCGGGHRGFS
jgi:putative FmdB family regulatory protein